MPTPGILIDIRPRRPVYSLPLYWKVMVGSMKRYGILISRYLTARARFTTERLHVDTSFLVRRFFHEEVRMVPLLGKSMLTGMLTACLALGFNGITHYLGRIRLSASGAGLPGLPEWVPGILLPALLVAVALTLVERFAPEAGGSGIQEIEGALAGLRPMPWYRLIPVKFFGGICSLASGLLLGREGPTVQLGGNVGKMVSDLTRSGADRENTLIAAGAGAGLAAAFNAPLAGMIFVVEEMRAHFKYSFPAILSVCAACVSSVVMIRVFAGQTPVLALPHAPLPSLKALFLFAALGCLFGVLGFVFNHLIMKTLSFFDLLRRAPAWLRGAGIGAFIGWISRSFPLLSGGGMEIIPPLIEGHQTVAILFSFFIFRLILSVFSYGTGAPGGIFAPMLALGTLFGLAFGQVAYACFPEPALQPGLFAVASMAALFSATVRAPITGIVLTAEMTMDFNLILPMMLTCLFASAAAYGLDTKPIYALLLKRTLDKASLQKPAVPGDS